MAEVIQSDAASSSEDCLSKRSLSVEGGQKQEDAVTDSKQPSQLKQRGKSTAENVEGQSKQGKLPVPEPAGFGKFFVVLLLFFSKRILIVDRRKQIGAYICIVFVVSLFTDIFPFPKSYFSQKGNVFNRFIVKFGTAWTVALVTPFILSTSYVLTLGNRNAMVQHASRMLVYFVTWLMSFAVIYWVENDFMVVSGHCFLLVFSSLTICEEAAVYSNWGKLYEAVRKGDENIQRRLGNSLTEFQRHMKQWTPFAQFWFFTMAFLHIVFNMMLLSTCLYFHNLPEKVAGVLAGLISWSFCYIVFPSLGFVRRPLVLYPPFYFEYLKAYQPSTSTGRSSRSGIRTPPTPTSSNPVLNLKIRS